MKLRFKIIYIVFPLLMLILITAYLGFSRPVIHSIFHGNRSSSVESYYSLADKYVWISCLWLFLLGMMAITLQFVIKRKYLGALIFNLLFVCLFYEGTIKLLFNQPELLRRLPPPIRWHVSNMYNIVDIRVIQSNEDQIRYDPYVTYTLRPGEFVAKNREFENLYRVNHLGLRDEEDSLVAPDIIVLGDSHGMGWGVEQEESFAQIIEKQSEYKVLNAAITSYATVRQMRLLGRLDLSNLKYLIIQYSSNDKEENLTFYKDGQLQITKEAEFKKHLAFDNKRYQYYPGKYIVFHLRRVVNYLNDLPKSVYAKNNAASHPPSESLQAKAFINAIHRVGSLDLNDVQIIVIIINNYSKSPQGFLDALNQEKVNLKYPVYIQKLQTVELASKLKEEHGYLLDVHLKAKGHQVIAEELLNVINDGGT